MEIKVNSFRLDEKGGRLTVSLEITYTADGCSSPKVKALFSCKEHTRRLPVLISSVEKSETETLIKAEYTYLLDKIFYGFKAEETLLELFLQENEEVIKINIPEEKSSLISGTRLKDGSVIISRQLMHKRSHIKPDELKNREVLKYVIRKPIISAFGLFYSIYCKLHPVVKNRVTIMSGRRTELGGNSEFVYKLLKDNKNAEIRFLFFEQKTGFSALKNLKSFISLYATSRVVIVDDFFRMLNLVKKRDGVTLIQLWHACGAFKTFGYTRLGKAGGPLQLSKSHRMYDYTFVSSSEVVLHYAEGFGINDYNVLPLGVARTDVFFDENYKQQVRESFYSRYPELRNKRIILFAPTFRGNGQQSAYYPLDRLDVNALADSLGEDYAVIIKLHPFCKERPAVRSDLKSRVLDLSFEDELNDLLFVTDILVTDYSSVVFEASLLNIPSLFYVFDLEEYVESRDFYYDFKSFVPGKIVKTEQELCESIENGDFEQNKLDAFRKKFFDNTDGASSKRAAELIQSLLEV